MKKYKRFLGLLLALLMLIPSNLSVLATETSAEEVTEKIYAVSGELADEMQEVTDEETGCIETMHTTRQIPTMFSVSDLNTGSGSTLTRGQWLENLTIMFDMTIESDDIPDNYFSDLTEDSEYYETVMLAVEFGVVDIAAGEALNLDDPCTREFAAKTLNYCLGFQLDEGTSYTFNDADECSDADSAQVAVNRGWFSLSGGAFMPEKTVTSSEVTAMANDTESILESSYVDDNYDSQYIFADFVVEIPEGTQVDIAENDVVTITGASEKINDGDTFVVYLGELPSLYLAEDVTVNGDMMTITTSDADEDAAVVSIDASGSVEVDLSQFEEAEGVSATYIETEAQARSAIQTYGISVKKNSIVASQTIPLGDGVEASIVVNLSDLKLNSNIETLKENYYVSITGTSTITSSVSIDALEAAGWSKNVVLGKVRVLGVGEVTVTVDLSLEGKATATYTGTFESGFQYRKSSGFRLVTSFKKKNFSTEVEANAKVGVKVSFGVDLIVVSGNIYATTGMAGKYVSKTYGDGTAPNKCTNISAWLYTTVGAYAKIPGKSFSKTLNIFDEKNSPVYVSFHWEDSVRVYSCTKGGGTYKYFTRDSSPYGCSYYGGAKSIGVGADGEPFTIFNYNLDEDNNATLTGYKGNVSALYIPETIDGYTVTKIGGRCFGDNNRLRSVVIPKTIVEIGCGAFKNCKNLQNINIPKQMETASYMGANSAYPAAFAGCSSLRSINFEEGITRIPNALFKDCDGIINIVIPDTVTTIHSSAFENCLNLREFKLSNNLTSISGGAFQNCENLENLELPKSMEVIGCAAFKDCKSLQSVYIPKKMVTADYMGANSAYPAAFAGCSALTDVEFEEGITKIVTCLFLDCSGLTQIIIPDSVTTIESSAFENCSNLKKVQIPKYLTNMGRHAFSGCSLIEEIDMPKSLEYIGCGAFKNCTSLKKIFIPKKMETDSSMGNSTGQPGVFYGCTNLKEVIFEEGISTIQNGLFYGCTGLEAIEIPDTVITMGSNAFPRCSNLKKVVLSKNLKNISYRAFYGCGLLTNITLPDTIEEISSSAFYECSALENIIFPESLKLIEQSAFESSGLKQLVIPKTIEDIGRYAFKGSLISKVEIEDASIDVEVGMFENCSNLVEVVFGKNISRIESIAFKNCDALESMNIPDTVTILGEQIFYDCDSLKNVTLGTGITSIPGSTFEHCDSLEKMILPYSIKSISSNAFKDCTSFTNITIPKSTNEIDGSAFSYPERLTIRGVSGSYAHKFANANSFKFEKINIPVTKITLADSNMTINCYTDAKIALSIQPLDMTDDVIWTSSNDDIVTVDENGNITANENGTATITVSVGSLTATCKVNVVQPVEYVGLDVNSITLNGSESYQLKVIISPDNAHNKKVIWSSSDDSIAKVDENGLVTAVSNGTAIITALASDGSGKCDTCFVDVKNMVNKVPSVSDLESKHNYPDNYEGTWVYTLNGANGITVTFDERTVIEDGFDFIYIFDENDTQIGKYTGKELSGRAVTINGDTVKIKLVSDDSGNAWGFKVESVEQIKEPTGIPTAEPTKEPMENPTAEPTKEPTGIPTESTEPNPSEIPEGTKPVTEAFTDVYKDWYYDYVQYVYDNELMTGIKGTTLFQPNNNITKAQVAQVLYNMEGQPVETDKNVFSDLKDVYEAEWYANAVSWAYNKGVVTGDLNTKRFSPNANVTREQLALMIYRYAQFKKYSTIQSSDLSGLKNAENVSNWASDGVRWAVGAGLISGVEKNGVKDLAPQGNATRAQVAAILMRFIKEYSDDFPENVLKWNGHTYMIFDNCLTWDDAKAYCESKGGYLATISSKEENDVLYTYMKECGYESAYFGFSDADEEGNWRWSNGEKSDYANWNSLEPSGSYNENYAMFFYIYEDGTWNDGAFLENIYDGGNAYICEWDMK